MASRMNLRCWKGRIDVRIFFLVLAYAMMGCLGSVVLAKYLGGKKL